VQSSWKSRSTWWDTRAWRRETENGYNLPPANKKPFHDIRNVFELDEKLASPCQLLAKPDQILVKLNQVLVKLNQLLVKLNQLLAALCRIVATLHDVLATLAQVLAGLRQVMAKVYQALATLDDGVGTLRQRFVELGEPVTRPVERADSPPSAIILSIHFFATMDKRSDSAAPRRRSAEAVPEQATESGRCGMMVA